MIWIWLLYILLFGAFFAMMYAWLTPETASMTGLAGSGTLGGFIGYIVGAYTWGEQYLEALILGTNENGQVLLFGLILFLLVMVFNALSDLAKDRPIRLIH